MTQQQALEQVAADIWESMSLFGRPDMVGIIEVGFFQFI